jgi:hypothetical protein
VPEGDHGNPDYSESDAGYGEDPFTVAIDYDAAYHLGGAEMLHPSQRPISQCEYWHEHPPEKPDPVTAHRQKNDEARNGAAWGGAIQQTTSGVGAGIGAAAATGLTVDVALSTLGAALVGAAGAGIGGIIGAGAGGWLSSELQNQNDEQKEFIESCAETGHPPDWWKPSGSQ